mmetsp:Transcript_9637/g.17888  ORF Transcript_9637/g.17888 Transcript_9637/m.17888 type:complete len:167 (+) Transcript_9637:53-553(+)
MDPASAAMPEGCAAWQRTALMIAARHGQDDVVARALETSCSQPQLDAVDEHGNTAVMIAAREGHKKVVESLVAAGAELSIANLAGQTAADLASTDEIRKVIQRGEAQAEAILRSILAMGKVDGAAETAAVPGYAAANSAGQGFQLPKELAALAAGLDLKFPAESPF